MPGLSATRPYSGAMTAPRTHASRAGIVRLAGAGRAAAAGSRDRIATDQSDRGAVRTVARRPDLGGLRARGHPRGPGPGRGRGAAPRPAHHHRHRRPAGDPRHLLPAGHRRVSRGRRRLRRLPGQPRAGGQPGGGGRPHRRLHADRRRLDRRRGRGLHLGLPVHHRCHRPPLPRDPGPRHPPQPAGARRDGAGLPAAHDGLHRRPAGHHRRWAHPSPGSGIAPDRHVARADPRTAGRDRPARAEGLFRRVQRPDRRGGHRQRRAPVQGAPAGTGQAHRAPPRGHPRRHAAGARGAGQALAHRSPLPPDGAQPDHGHGRRSALGVLHRLADHHPGPGAGGQHLLRRSPRPGQPARPRQLPAPPVRPARRPPGVRQRDLGAGRDVRCAPRGGPGQHQHDDPAVRHRRLHRLHPGPDRPRPALAQAATARVAPTAPSSTVPAR